MASILRIKPNQLFNSFHSHLPLSNPSKTLFSLYKSMSWSCSKCTFINPSSQKSTCEICSSTQDQNQHPPLSSSASPSSSSSPSKPKWACKACTFLNSYQKTSCEICGTRGSASFVWTIEDDEELDSSVGNVFLPLQPCKRKNKENSIEVVDGDDVDSGGFRGLKSAKKAAVTLSDETNSIKKWKIMTYNVWFREDLEMHMRMNALGYLIQLHAPDFICFQEVTPNIYHIFEQSSWWKAYRCSVSNVMASTRPYFCMQLSKLPVRSYSTKPFNNSIMGRELCVAEVEIDENTPLIFATTHLESPCPAPPKWDQMFSKERVFQANEALTFLKKYPNTIFCGDMNWDEKLDGKFPLLDGWVDSWEQVKPGDDGYTYDTKANKMLSGNRTLQKRLDRAICKLRDFEICGIDMIGMEAIPGLSYVKEKKVRKEVVKMELPVLPSDHYGLLLTISTK